MTEREQQRVRYGLGTMSENRIPALERDGSPKPEYPVKVVSERLLERLLPHTSSPQRTTAKLRQDPRMKISQIRRWAPRSGTP
jgi:hypothetical protein